MILIILLAGLALALLGLGYLAIKIWGITKGAKRIYGLVSYFRKGQRYDRLNTTAEQAYNTQCLFCLGNAVCPALASCNHTYCSKCVLQFFVHENKRKLECPACKQPINILIRNFEPTNPTQEQLKIGLCEYNKRHSSQSPFVRSVRQAASLMPQILRWATSRQGITNLYQNGRLKTIVFSLLYMMSPIDFLPEAILGPFGLIDDSLVGMNILRTLTNHFMDYVRSRDETELRLFRHQQQQRVQGGGYPGLA